MLTHVTCDVNKHLLYQPRFVRYRPVSDFARWCNFFYRVWLDKIIPVHGLHFLF